MKDIFKDCDKELIEATALNTNEAFYFDVPRRLYGISLELQEECGVWCEYLSQNQWHKIANPILANGSKFFKPIKDVEAVKICSNDRIGITKVVFYTLKIAGLIIAGRFDGCGARLMPFLNALYLSSKFPQYRFGFVWVTRVDTAKSQASKQGVQTEDMEIWQEEEVFSQRFIEQYSYTKCLEKNGGKMIGKSELVNEDFAEEFGFFINHDPRLILSDIDKNAFKEYPRMFDCIEWSPRLQSAIQEANKKAQELGEFVVVHIRSGDIVFDGLQNAVPAGCGKAMPIEIAQELIEISIKAKKAICITGDDVLEVELLRQHYAKKGHIFTLRDIAPCEYLEMERILFDIVFMSKATEIYSGGSSFAKVAGWIGLGRYPKMYYPYFGVKRCYEIINSRILCDIEGVHYLQKVYSASAAFLFGLSCGAEPLALLKHIDMAIAKGPEITWTRFAKLLLMPFLAQGDKKCLVDFIVQFIKSKDTLNIPKSTLLVLQTPYMEKYCELQKVNNIPLDSKSLILEQLQTQNIAFQNKIKQMESFIDSKTRIHSHLAYKLGSAMILNSKSLWGYIRMPYVLSYIKESHREEQRKYQEKVAKNPSLKLPKLESYPDYKEAIKEKQCFTYKLGEALIKANNVRGGGRIFAYLQFFKEVRELKREFKEKRK